MRLICPNCGAQYEVPADVIPDEGRDVQCSACSSTWFQAHPDHPVQPEASAAPAPQPETHAQPEPEPEPQHPPEPEPQPETPARQKPAAPRGLDPEISDVLRQEAEYEATARAAERNAPLESQPDLGLDDGGRNDEVVKRAREARLRMARMRGEPVQDDATAVAEATAAAAGSRRDLLPDIEEINSTLRASGERRRPAEATDTDLPGSTPRVRPRRRGFRTGFLGVVVITALAVAAYVYAPRLGTAVPSAAPMVQDYVEGVDQLRAWLASSLDKGLGWLDQMASENL